MSKRILAYGLSSAALMLVLACGGGGGGDTPAPKTATGFSYTNPTGVAGTSWYMNQNTSLSTPASHLVLDLYGPATALKGTGVVLTLSVDTTKATWGNVSGSSPVANGTVFAPNAGGDPIVQGKVSGGVLQVVVSERGLSTAKDLTGPLLRVALDLASGQKAGSAVTITPDLTKSKVMLQNGDMSALAGLQVGSTKLQ